MKALIFGILITFLTSIVSAKNGYITSLKIADSYIDANGSKNTNDHVEIAFTDNVLNMDCNPFSWLQVEDDVGRYLPTVEQQKNCQVKSSINMIDLACHQGEDDSLQIYVYGRGENWSKVYGPYLILFEYKAGSPQASWRDAKSRYVKQRGSVIGKLTIKNPLNNSAFRLEDAVVTLNRFLINNGVIILSGLIVFQGNVIPGTYQLRAWSKGVVGEFILNKSITVTAGRTTNLGEIVFTEKRVGPVAWEIGIPDRTAKEFKHGDHFNQWGLPYKFPKEFPNSINYTIGKSNYARDWNYCHVSVSIPGRGGTSVLLYVSVAANSYTALSVSINGGKNSAEVANFKDDACVRRDGIRGFYRELEFKFGPNDFKVGENKITLHSRKTRGYTNNHQFDGYHDASHSCIYVNLGAAVLAQSNPWFDSRHGLVSKRLSLDNILDPALVILCYDLIIGTDDMNASFSNARGMLRNTAPSRNVDAVTIISVMDIMGDGYS
ncbi:hypothetical protein H8356DRAFT_1424554 [Neocallimastix lanati (nom. inval.)]|nr:hypothetical protein H8356DRAFT_1424554 [Neocallimastix sp. JGI-2020a]